jgi:hypothetical protein
MQASQPVIFLRTVGVEVPKNDWETSPPKEAPNPKLLLSWIKIKNAKRRHKRKNEIIEK